MSALTTVFYQECPTCGRSLRVAVKYFGRAMSCAHCGGQFTANPSEMHSTAPLDPTASAQIFVDLTQSARMATSQAPQS